MKKTGNFLGTALLTMVIIINTTLVAFAEEPAANKYEHDPRLNQKAMEDIIVDPNAVFGFSPDPESTRLKEYAAYDWSNNEVVIKAMQDRINYLADYDNMYATWEKMEKEGKSIEEIARTVSGMRNQIRLDSYKDNPEGLAKVKKSNIETYGNEFGPTPESLFEKYGSWDKVLLKSFSSNPGMDACLGLYDIQYEHNKLIDAIVENKPIIYVVKKGDNLSKIAKKYYGDQKAYMKIYNANKDKIGSRFIIYEGEKLIISLD